MFIINCTQWTSSPSSSALEEEPLVFFTHQQADKIPEAIALYQSRIERIVQLSVNSMSQINLCKWTQVDVIHLGIIELPIVTQSKPG